MFLSHILFDLVLELNLKNTNKLLIYGLDQKFSEKILGYI